nr:MULTISPECIES: hypothetical protein [unclassified Sphingomonas]
MHGNVNGNVQPAEAVVESVAPAPAQLPLVADEAGEAPAPRRRGRPRREQPANEAEAPQGIDLAVLPPAIGAEAASAEEEAPKKPRRRRTTKTDEVEAPAA